MISFTPLPYKLKSDDQLIFDRYLESLNIMAKDFQIPILELNLDAGEWAATELWGDNVHMNISGARKYTDRLKYFLIK